MTERRELQKGIVADLREQSDLLKYSIATWQLLTKAADEIERLQKLVDRDGEKQDAC